MVKNLTSKQEMWVQSLGLVRCSGNGNPFQYSCLRNPWTEEPGGLQSMGLQKSQT